MTSTNETSSPELAAPPITVDVLQHTAGKLGVKVPQNVEHDFAELMKGTREAILEVAAMDGMY